MTIYLQQETSLHGGTTLRIPTFWSENGTKVTLPSTTHGTKCLRSCVHVRYGYCFILCLGKIRQKQYHYGILEHKIPMKLKLSVLSPFLHSFLGRNSGKKTPKIEMSRLLFVTWKFTKLSLQEKFNWRWPMASFCVNISTTDTGIIWNKATTSKLKSLEKIVLFWKRGRKIWVKKYLKGTFCKHNLKHSPKLSKTYW